MTLTSTHPFAKRAVIIGASSGIGMEVAKLLHADGWTIGVAGRRTDRLAQLKATLGTRVEVQQIDVDEAQATDALHALISALGGVELIFLAAGIGKQNPALLPDIELQTVATNALGFTRIVGAAYRYFAAQPMGGHLAVISSIAGTKGLGAAPAYSATKRFQNTYLQALAQLARAKRLPVAITDIRPGFVDTDLIKGSKFPMTMRPEAVARQIVRALYKRKRVAIIDWRYRLLVCLWRGLPNCLWERLPLVK